MCVGHYGALCLNVHYLFPTEALFEVLQFLLQHITAELTSSFRSYPTWLFPRLCNSDNLLADRKYRQFLRQMATLYDLSTFLQNVK
jgi:hypothetical protein